MVAASGSKLWPVVNTLMALAAVDLTVNTAHASEAKPAIRILRDECLNCHRPGKAKGGLLLHTREKMMAGGDSGEVVIPGRGSDSLLLQVLHEDGDPHMPPKGQLPVESIATIQRWIDAGAEWDATVFDEPPVRKEIALTPPHSSYQAALSLALFPGARYLAVARGNRVSLLDLQSGTPIVVGELVGHTEPVQSLSWSTDGTRLATGGFQRVIVWDFAEKKMIREIGDPLVGDITGVAWSVDGEALFVADGVAGGAGFLHRIGLSDGDAPVTWKGHDDTIYSLKVSPDGKYLLSGGADKNVRLWDVATRSLVAGLEGHTNHVLAVCFNKDGSRIASAGADREIKIWDVANREQIISLGDKKSTYTSLDWSGGDHLVVATDKGAVSIYTEFKVHEGVQRSVGAKEKKLNAVSEMLNAVCVSPDGTRIFGAGFEGNVHAWDAKAGTSAPVDWKQNL
jgi:WD40 repeat protein